MEGLMDSPVEEFYKGKTVFITGATGFMGKVVLCKIWLKLETFSFLLLLKQTLAKVLVEKLLRSTSVARIYLLIRPKVTSPPNKIRPKVRSAPKIYRRPKV